MAQLRSALFLQAAITAFFGLWRGGGGGWTIATMVVAAAAVFIGAALQATPEMRKAAIAFEAAAVAFGVIGIVVGHYVPGTIVAAGALAQLLGANAGLAFTGTPKATLQAFGAPAFEAPAVEAPAPAFEAPAQLAPPTPQFAAPVLEAPVREMPAFEMPAAPEALPVELLVVPAQAVPLTAQAAITVLPQRR